MCIDIYSDMMDLFCKTSKIVIFLYFYPPVDSLITLLPENERPSTNAQ